MARKNLKHYAKSSSMNDSIARFLATVPPEELGNICSINLSEEGMTVAWVWLPSDALTEFEGRPVFHAQLGKYAFSNSD
jgi:hypothetical protein